MRLFVGIWCAHLWSFKTQSSWKRTSGPFWGQSELCTVGVKSTPHILYTILCPNFDVNDSPPLTKKVVVESAGMRHRISSTNNYNLRPNPPNWRLLCQGKLAWVGPEKWKSPSWWKNLTQSVQILLVFSIHPLQDDISSYLCSWFVGFHNRMFKFLMLTQVGVKNGCWQACFRTKNCLARDINFQEFFLATIELGGSFFFDGPSACHIMEVGQHAAELRSNTITPFGLTFNHLFWSSGWVFSPSVDQLHQVWTVGCQACTQFKQTRDCKMYRFSNLS